MVSAFVLLRASCAGGTRESCSVAVVGHHGAPPVDVLCARHLLATSTSRTKGVPTCLRLRRVPRAGLSTVLSTLSQYNAPAPKNPTAAGRRPILLGRVRGLATLTVDVPSCWGGGVAVTPLFAVEIEPAAGVPVLPALRGVGELTFGVLVPELIAAPELVAVPEGVAVPELIAGGPPHGVVVD